MIYLASPYSHDDSNVRHHRYLDAKRATEILLNAGYFVYSPIVHSRFLEVESYGSREWIAHGREMIGICASVFVLMIDGWKRSIGVQTEIKHAIKLRKIIKTVDLESGGQWRITPVTPEQITEMARK